MTFPNARHLHMKVPHFFPLWVNRACCDSKAMPSVKSSFLRTILLKRPKSPETTHFQNLAALAINAAYGQVFCLTALPLIANREHGEQNCKTSRFPKKRLKKICNINQDLQIGFRHLIELVAVLKKAVGHAHYSYEDSIDFCCWSSTSEQEQEIVARLWHLGVTRKCGRAGGTCSRSWSNQESAGALTAVSARLHGGKKTAPKSSHPAEVRRNHLLNSACCRVMTTGAFWL